MATGLDFMPYTTVPAPRMPRRLQAAASGLAPLAPDAEDGHEFVAGFECQRLMDLS